MPDTGDKVGRRVPVSGLLQPIYISSVATGVTGIPNASGAREPASVVQPVTVVVISTLDCVLGLNTTLR